MLVGVWVVARVVAWWLTGARLAGLVAAAMEMVAVGGHAGEGRARNESFDAFVCFTWMKMSQICLAMLISSQMNLKPMKIRHMQLCLAK